MIKFFIKNFILSFILLNLIIPSVYAQIILKNSKAKENKKTETITDYSFKYPKSTDAEFLEAANQMKSACEGFQVKAEKINPKLQDAKKENKDQVCECLKNNLFSAHDIHEMQVLKAHFLGQELPESVFADEPEINDAFDERNDYLENAHITMGHCLENPKFNNESKDKSPADVKQAKQTPASLKEKSQSKDKKTK